MCPFGKKTVYFCQCTSLSPTRGWTCIQAVIKEVTSWVSCCWALLFVLKALICLLSQEIFPWKLFHLEVCSNHSNVSCGRRQRSICAVSCPFCKTALIWVSAFPSSWPFSVFRLPQSWAFCTSNQWFSNTATNCLCPCQYLVPGKLLNLKTHEIPEWLPNYTSTHSLHPFLSSKITLSTPMFEITS